MGYLVCGLADGAGLLHHGIFSIRHGLVSAGVPRPEDEPAIGNDKGIVDNREESLLKKRNNPENLFCAPVAAGTEEGVGWTRGRGVSFGPVPWPATGCPHWLQNRIPAASGVPQAVQNLWGDGMYVPVSGKM